MEESIIGRLHFDHLKIYPLLQDLENSSTVSERTSKFENLKALIVPLLEAEDEAILKKLLDIPDNNARTIRESCFNEHHDMRDLLQRLNLMNIAGKKWMKNYKVFRSLVLKHCQTEEEKLFPEMKEDFSREELIEIGFAFEEAKGQSYHEKFD